jgi:hypothetical protein
VRDCCARNWKAEAHKRWRPAWADVIPTLDNLIEMEVAISGEGYVLRGQTPGAAGTVFQPRGFALPPHRAALIINLSTVRFGWRMSESCIGFRTATYWN